MYLFRERRDTLQGGMVNSMQVRLMSFGPERRGFAAVCYRAMLTLCYPLQYLYLDSEVWNSVKTLLWRKSPCFGSAISSCEADPFLISSLQTTNRHASKRGDSRRVAEDGLCCIFVMLHVDTLTLGRPLRDAKSARATLAPSSSLLDHGRSSLNFAARSGDPLQPPYAARCPPAFYLCLPSRSAKKE